MRQTYHLHGLNAAGHETGNVRPAIVTVGSSEIIVDLGRGDNGQPKDEDAPRIYIEWRPGDGWVAIFHNNDGDPVGRITFLDAGGYIIGEDS